MKYDPQSGKVPVRIVIGSGAERLDRAGARQLERHFNQPGFNNSVETQIVCENQIGSLRDEGTGLFIYLGVPARHDALRHQLDEKQIRPPHRDEGYLITTVRRNPPALIIAGNDTRGTFYGVQSLVQMITLKNGRPAVRALEIRDWPAYGIRGTGNDVQIPQGDVSLHAVTNLSHFKFNTWAVGQSYHWPENWRKIPEDRLNALLKAAAVAETGMIDIMFQVHPFGRAGDPKGEYTITISSESDREKLLAICLKLLDAGVKDILLRADDFSDLSEQDRLHYRDKASAHADLLGELRKNINKKGFPETSLVFCPPYYEGSRAFTEPEVSQYYEVLTENIPDDIVLMWSGPDVVSRQITRTQALRFEKIIGSKPLLWDNTVFRVESDFGYPYMYAWYMLHPFRTSYPSDFYRISKGIRFNYGCDGSRLGLIANIVLAQYLWNPGGYEPERALRDAISLVAGPAAVDAVLACAEEIQTLFDLRHSPARFLSKNTCPEESHFRSLLGELKAKSADSALAEELEGAWYSHASTAEAFGRISEKYEKLHDDKIQTFPVNLSDWQTSVKGDWRAFSDGEVIRFTFPYNTPSEAGTYAEAEKNIKVPPTPTGRYHLVFMADDDYYDEGEPPEAWPGFFYKCVLIDGEVIWEEDVHGMEPPELIMIDVSEQLSGHEEVSLILRGCDRKGVTNLGVQISFSPFLLVR